MKDRIVLITGGSSGLGLASAKAFINEGTTVLIAARSHTKFEDNIGKENPKLRFISTDFSSMVSVRKLYSHIENEYKTIDIAVNNVGSSLIKPMIDYDEAEFDYSMNVNLKSLWLSMKHQIPLMLKDKPNKKHIINISSLNGLGGAEYLSLYAAAKAGVISLTKSAALEMAKENISINAIAPGPFETPMLEDALLSQAGGDNEKLKGIQEQYKQIIPKGRFGDPAEIAEMIVWLCQGKSSFMSGHTIIIDGGLSSRFR